MEKAKDLANKALDKSSECSALATALSPFSYGTKIAEELQGHGKIFEQIYVNTTQKIQGKTDLKDEDLMVFAKQYVQQTKASSSVLQAAAAFTAGSKGKPKRAPKAKAASGP